MTSLFIMILIIYTAITYRPENLPKPLPNDTTYETGWPLGANKFGYSAIFSMPCSLMVSGNRQGWWLRTEMLSRMGRARAGRCDKVGWGSGEGAPGLTQEVFNLPQRVYGVARGCT